MLGGLGLIDSLRPGKQFFSHVGMEPPLPDYYQYFLGSKCALLKGKKRFDPSGARTPNLWYFKFRSEMLRLHAFWYFVPFGCDLSIYGDAFSYYRVARSDKITYVRIWNIPIEYRIIMIRAPDLAPSNTCRSIHLDMLHHVPARSVAVGCSFGFTTLTITIESDYDFSHDWTRQV